ncbi:MAG TPA: M23 family metallopeptidase [Rhizomicrobium sp.]|jgi:murein DD-endopeptidase MepM/ murein hydrolase activator NlpD|nr:M23 family metallopeptidase [Rhizomicrobium sp.]
MIHRRALLASGAFAALPFTARAQASRLSFAGSRQQGSLVVGRTLPGTRVTVDGAAVSVSPEGIFAFGLEYDQKPPAKIAARYADGTAEEQGVLPVPRQYEVQAINGLPHKFVQPSPEELARIKSEHARVGVARTTDSGATWFTEPFDWPAKGIISGLFGSQRILNGIPSAPHMGVDIAGGEGAPIHAPANATVLIADQFYLEGGYTLLDHGHGVFTGYMHQSVQLVKPGDAVQRGQQIGNIGHTGRATGPHLHWQMNWFQVRLDPSLSARTLAPDKA